MRIYVGLTIGSIIFMAGILSAPISVFSFFPAEIKNMHKENKEHIEQERDRFRQDVLEKRKELLQEWHQKKQGIKERFEKGKERVTSEFQDRREHAWKEKVFSDNGKKNIMPTTENTSSDRLYTIFKRTVDGMLHIFSPLKVL